MTRSASALAAAGNNMGQSIAMITEIFSITRNAESTGTALKTLSLRLRGAKVELEEAGLETDGMAESTSKLREKILALSGVDIMKDSKNFKSTYDIMNEISKVWKDISDVDQAALIELMGGQRQGNSLAALLNNMSEAEEVYVTATNSAGSAEAEHAKYLDSIQGKADKLKASFQSLSSSFISSDTSKGALDFANGFIQTLDAIISKVGSLPVLFTTAFGVLGSQGSGFIGPNGITKYALYSQAA